MLIGGVKDVLLEQGQTGGDEGSWGGRLNISAQKRLH